jgi:hypothetical protein
MHWILEHRGIKGQLTAETKSADAPNNVFAASANPQERGNSVSSGMRQQEIGDDGVLPRSPLVLIVGLTAFLLVARSFARAN